jgi:hypothetical protein
MDDIMQKEELLYIHSVLAQVKRHIEAERADTDFSGYVALRISASHVHRSKNDHKRAIFILGEEISRGHRHMYRPGRKTPRNLGHQRKSVSRSKGLTMM